MRDCAAEVSAAPDRGPAGTGKPASAVTGRSSRTSSVSSMVALACALLAFQAGPP